MDSLAAFAMGQATRGKEMMVFDWQKAARLIREVRPQVASAGLRSDWEYTGGTIYANGKPVTDSYTFLSSTWAVPEIDLDGEVQPCFLMESEAGDWGSDTNWPDIALDILNG